MRTRGIRVTVWFLVLLLAVLVVPIIYQLVVGSITKDELLGGNRTFTWSYYSELIDSKDNLTAAGNTLVFALGSMMVAIVIGGFQAVVAERTNTPFRRLAYLSAIILIGMPYLVYVIAWVLVLGRNGVLNTLLKAITGSDNPAIFDVNSLFGMILIEGFIWSPLAFLLIAASLKQVNPAFEEAARMSGAGIFTVLRRVTIPLAWPAILAVALLAFVRATEAFEVPAIVGLPGGVDVITTQVYLTIHQGFPPNYGFANALSMVLMIVVGGLLWWYGRLSRSAEKYQVITGSNYRPAVLDLGRWKYLWGAASASLFAVLIYVPLGMLLWVSILPVYQGVNSSMFDFSLGNFVSALQAPSLVQGAINTIVLCLAASVIACAVAAGAAWLVIRRAPLSGVLDQLMSFPLVVPGIVLGLAVSQVALSSPFGLYGSLWILLFGYLITFLPFAMRYAYTGVIQIHPSLEECALVMGASYGRMFRRIVLPLLAPAIVAGGLFVFLQGVRALSMPVLLASPEHPVAAVSLYDMFVNGSTTNVAAFGVIWTVVMVAFAAVLNGWARRSNVALF